MTDALDFLDAIRGVARAQLPPGARLATIDPSYTAPDYPDTVPLPQVTFDGEDTLSTKRYPVAKHYVPGAGDRVLMIPIGHTYLIAAAIRRSGGAVDPLNVPRIRLWNSSSGSVANDAGLTGTAYGWSSSWTTVEHQVGFGYDDSSAATWSKIVPLVDGCYDLECGIVYELSATGRRVTTLRVNGTTLATDESRDASASVYVRTYLHRQAIELAAGDEVEMTYAQNSGGSLGIVAGRGSTFLSATWRGPLA